MFEHRHPYAPFNLENATKLIVGTLPPPRFTTGQLDPADVDFCYGSKNGMLWPILDTIFSLDLVYENTQRAIDQRKEFLLKNHIGVCDIVACAQRKKVDASDIGMLQVEVRDLISILQKHPQINTLLFMGGNSKNGPEYFFRRQAKKQKVPIETTINTVPRQMAFKVGDRMVRGVTFTAPSGAANRAIGGISDYKRRKKIDPDYTTFDFRVEQYAPFFREK